MNKKISCILISMLMLVSAIVTINISDTGEGTDIPPELNTSNPLNMTYIWDWTRILANVTYEA